MKKYSALILFAILFFWAFSAQAKEPAQDTQFETLRCAICHKADTGTVYPSLKEITKAYNGNEEKLIDYFNGKSDPIVKPAKSKIMKTFLESIKALSESDIKNLADFILSHKD